MSKAVIYARFSCSKQREASIEDQLRVCRSWAETNGYEVVAEYCDYAISVWLPKAQTRRTLLVAVDAGQVLIRLARAA